VGQANFNLQGVKQVIINLVLSTTVDIVQFVFVRDCVHALMYLQYNTVQVHMSFKV
jgi:hypothetical protein